MLRMMQGLSISIYRDEKPRAEFIQEFTFADDVPVQVQGFLRLIQLVHAWGLTGFLRQPGCACMT